MSNYDIIRAWKDEDYLESLSEEQRVLVPENPAGMIELSDEDMEVVAGGIFKNTCICIDIDINIINITNSGGQCNISNDSANCFNF
ncbi:MAG: mersacidin/lichenicidin family type 2 lantibiotic [Pleurocapsa sp. MO_192.B19]|nr:mersacidin/lichenicidin family type 2 lantibiotic [Pleurocapsa sp. MO_192.B19]